MLKVVQVMQGCCCFSVMEEEIAKLPILEILPILFAHLPVLILHQNPHSFYIQQRKDVDHNDNDNNNKSYLLFAQFPPKSVVLLSFFRDSGGFIINFHVLTFVAFSKVTAIEAEERGQI